MSYEVRTGTPNETTRLMKDTSTLPKAKAAAQKVLKDWRDYAATYDHAARDVIDGIREEVDGITPRHFDASGALMWEFKMGWITSRLEVRSLE